MVVIHDDIDLAYERLKIKEKGGDGGHNGIRSLIDALGTDDFVRVRMGVGRPPANIGVVEHVLSEFDATQRTTLELFLSRAIEAVEADGQNLYRSYGHGSSFLRGPGSGASWP